MRLMHTWKVEVTSGAQCIYMREYESLTLDRTNREEQEGMNSREIWGTEMVGGEKQRSRLLTPWFLAVYTGVWGGPGFFTVLSDPQHHKTQCPHFRDANTG